MSGMANGDAWAKKKPQPTLSDLHFVCRGVGGSQAVLGGWSHTWQHLWCCSGLVVLYPVVRRRPDATRDQINGLSMCSSPLSYLPEYQFLFIFIYWKRDWVTPSSARRLFLALSSAVILSGAQGTVCSVGNQTCVGTVKTSRYLLYHLSVPH